MTKGIRLESLIFPDPGPNKVYISGGTVRNLLLHKKPEDYEVLVSHGPDDFARRISKKNNGRIISWGKPNRRRHRVVANGVNIDVTQMDGRKIQDDLLKRDFTINAMACEPVSGKTVDPTGGLKDIDKKMIRAISPAVFISDPARLIRAFRLAACLKFSIEPGTFRLIQEHGHRIVQTAGERIRKELIQIFLVPDSYKYIALMSKSGLLDRLFPEINALKGCVQGPKQVYDVFDHTMESYRCLETLLNEEAMCRFGNPGIGNLWQDRKRKALLKFAILLHDVGKFPARSRNSKGHVCFYGHGIKGAALFKDIGHRLRLSRNEADYIGHIIRNHIRSLFLFKAFSQKKIGPAGLIRFFLKYDQKVPDILVHTMADIQGKGNPTEIRNREFIKFAMNLLEKYFNSYRILRKQPPLINGRDLMRRFNLKPSAAFKRIITRVEEARLSGNIHSRAEADNLVKNLIRTGRVPKK